MHWLSILHSTLWCLKTITHQFVPRILDVKQGCPTRGPRATSWPAMLSGVARVEIKVVKKLHSSYFGCKQGEKLTLFTGTTKARAFKKSFNLSFLTCRVTVDWKLLTEKTVCWIFIKSTFHWKIIQLCASMLWFTFLFLVAYTGVKSFSHKWKMWKLTEEAD